MSKNGYYGDFASIHEEREAFNEYNKYRNDQEPNCVPCYECMKPMYEVSDNPQLNICDSCTAEIEGRAS